MTNKMTTCLWFDHGQAREAAEFYASVFPDSEVTTALASPADNPSTRQGQEITVEFTVCGQSFVGLNGGSSFTPNGAVSFQVFTDTQEETDRYWHAIVGNGGEESDCSWCKDRWGFSWQIVPRALMAGMADPDPAAAKRVMQAMMTMQKIDIAAIEAARAGAGGTGMTGPVHELAIERVFDAPRETVWRAVTGHLSEWWCPRPWTSEVVALEWESGGPFAITMHGPDGEIHAGDGMLLEVVPGERFVFTNLLGQHWNPQDPQPVGIVGTFAFADTGDGKTRFRSSARHRSEAELKAHAEMGFEHGWGQCADQLGEVAVRLAKMTDA